MANDVGNGLPTTSGRSAGMTVQEAKDQSKGSRNLVRAISSEERGETGLNPVTLLV